MFYFFIFLKGIVMGLADLVPGISGGTIAFITGVYERLMNAIKGFSYGNFKKSKVILFSKKDKFSSIVELFDLKFLFFLGFGIVGALLIGARAIEFLLENYLINLLAFFVGLILASTLIIYKEISEHSYYNLLFGVIGLLIGTSFLFFSPLQVVEPTLLYIFFGGFIAITALFLPGISGSFILLILGLYEFMINKLNNITSSLKEISVFLLGGLIGAVIISRIISFFFRKDKCKTLYFLVGLVLGSLSIPLIRIYQTLEVFSITSISIIFLMILLGIGVVMLIEKLS